MKSIERVHLSSIPSAVVRMPVGCIILSVGVEKHELGDLPFLSVLADVDATREKRSFWVLGNGPHAPADASGYIGSVTTSDGHDFHVFDMSVDLTD